MQFVFIKFGTGSTVFVTDLDEPNKAAQGYVHIVASHEQLATVLVWHKTLSNKTLHASTEEACEGRLYAAQ